MRAIIWKEIRENLKWAVLWMLGVTLAMAWVLYSTRNPGWYPGHVLMCEHFKMWTMLGAAAGATLLGLLQTVPEFWRGQWAFLIHRPITMRGLFFGKVVGGLVLYGAGMLLPLCGAVVWAMIPGRVAAPFSWRATLPAVADILGGVAFYFAALLIGMRQVRWYGSRVLPLALAICCEALVMGVPEFWQAVIVVAVSVGILAAAAWGSMAASGQYRSQPVWAKAALGIVLCVGVTCIGGIAAGIVEAFIERPPGEVSAHSMDKEGRILCFSYDSQSGVIRSANQVGGGAGDIHKGKVFYELLMKELLQFSCLRTESPSGSGTYRSSWRFFPMPSLSAPWYYVPSERLLVGYDSKTQRRSWTAGPGGLSLGSVPPSERFPEGMPWCFCTRDYTCILVFPSAVYSVNSSRSEVRVLMRGTREEPVLGAGLFGADSGTGGAGDSVGVVTAKHIYLFGSVLTSPTCFANDVSSKEYPNVSAAALPKGGYAIWLRPSYSARSPSKKPEHVIVLSETGAVLKRYDVPPTVWPSSAPTWTEATFWALITPIAGLLAFVLIGAMIGDPVVFPGMSDHPGVWAYAAFILIVGAVLWALLAFGITRRYLITRRQTWGWAVAGFVLGPVGVITLLILRDWPARVTCASCGRMRVVDQDRCGHCGAAFPPSAPTGRELFDGHMSEATSVPM